MATGRGTVNKVILLGRLGQDPELKYTPSGAAVANFSLATNEVWKDKEGNKKERTEWHRIVLWHKTAELASEYLKKGSRLYVEGRLQTRSWDDKDGNKRYMTEVVGDTITFIDTRTEGGSGSQETSQSTAPESSEPTPPAMTDEDDLPF